MIQVILHLQMAEKDEIQEKEERDKKIRQERDKKIKPKKQYIKETQYIKKLVVLKSAVLQVIKKDFNHFFFKSLSNNIYNLSN